MNPRWNQVLVDDSNCQRCETPSPSLITSMFCKEQICHDCSNRERRHSAYADAARADADAYRSGNEFPGIGKPADL